MFEYISVFDLIYAIDRNNWKTWVKVEYWNWQSSFINNFRQQEKIMEPLN